MWEGRETGARCPSPIRASSKDRYPKASGQGSSQGPARCLDGPRGVRSPKKNPAGVGRYAVEA